MSRRSLRVRLTALATALLVLGLVLGAVGLAEVVAGRLSEGVRATAHDRAAAVASSFDLAVLTRAPAAVQRLPDDGDGVLVQVQDAQGRVRASDLPFAGEVLDPRARVSARGLPVRTAVVTVPGGRVVAAAPAGSVADGVRAVVLSLVVGVPVLGGAVAVTCWVLVGLALRPVERLRSAAAAVLPGGDGPPPGAEEHDEVARLAATLDGLLARLDAAAQRQSRFVADAAHELRSPLASARVQLEVALLDPSAEHWRETAEDVLAEVLRLGRLVEDLLRLARADASPRAAPGEPGPVDLVRVAQRVVAQVSPASRVPVGVVAEAPSLTVRMPADAAAQVLRNLLDNAVRHAATRVVVLVRRDGEHAEVRVSDDGPGVPEGQAERVFERFARLDDARGRDAGGSGLGLAIARDLARAAGGTLDLVPGTGGARVRLRLPRVPDEG